MAFRILATKSKSFGVEFSPSRRKVANQISIVVGPNGVGKTRLLAALANKYRLRKSSTNFKDSLEDFDVEVAPGSLLEPSRVVAQTFSPFSRFPADRRQFLRFKEYLNEGEEKYAAIGFTRAFGIRGSVSKDAVGRIVRKLVTRPDQAAPLGIALQGLGFHPRIELLYVATPSSTGMDITGSTKTGWRMEVGKFLESIEKRDRVFSEQVRVKRELTDSTELRETLVNEIADALSTIWSLESKPARPLIGTPRPEFKIELTLERKLLKKTSVLLKAIVTLNRFGILRLRDCNFFPNGSRKEWTDGFSDKDFLEKKSFDITDASSGEQQLLSSLFGLVAEAEDDALILMDEPELSLHPTWQTQFLDLLSDSLKGFTGCHVVIATHSALLAQRARELNFDIINLGDQAFRYLADRGKSSSVDQTLLETFGLAVRDSAYVSRLLLSLVMDAETSPKEAPRVRQTLCILKALYLAAPVQDKHVSNLIQDALELVADLEL